MRLEERFEHQAAPGVFLDFRPTLFFGVPTVYVRMLDFDAAIAREIGTFMRLFVSGSAPLPIGTLCQPRSLLKEGRPRRSNWSRAGSIAIRRKSTTFAMCCSPIPPQRCLPGARASWLTHDINSCLP